MTNEAMCELAQKVATVLGEDWTVEARSEDYARAGVYLKLTTDGKTISLQDGEYGSENRLVVYGHYAQEADGTAVMPRDCYSSLEPEKRERARITLSFSKSPGQIARDIAHRFLPLYTEQYNACKERAQMLDNNNAQIRANGERLMRINARLEKNLYRDELHLRQGHTDKCWGEVGVGAGYANMNLRSLSIEQAEKVLRVLVEN